MSKMVKREAETGRSLAKGLLAGLIGGVVATGVKMVADKVYAANANKTPGEKPAPVLLAERMADGVGHILTLEQQDVAAHAAEWGFGAAAGAVYGGLAEYFPAVTAKDGASFGLSLVTMNSKGLLPMGAPRDNAEEHAGAEGIGGMASLVVFGLITETVRRVVRKRLG